MDEHKPQYWGVMPAEVRYCPGLPATAKVLYTEISALTQMDGICVKDNAYFCQLYKISERTLQGHLKALARQGFIAILDGDGGQGRRRIYAGINPLAHNPAKNCGVGANPAENCGVTPQKTAGTYKDIQDLSQDPPIAPQGAGEGKPEKKKRRTRAKAACDYEPELFERFWKAYPRGEAKAEARYEWDELRPDLKLMREMSAALTRQKKSAEWLRDGGKAVPYACRWLSHRRWEDETGKAPGDSSTPQPPRGSFPAQGSQGREEAIEWEN